jgi:hypothetical protein
MVKGLSNMEKVIRDGKVAVLYSEGFGAGWSTWNKRIEGLVFHPKIVDMVLQGRQNEIDRDWLVENLGEEYANVYCGGVDGLSIIWLPLGTMFRIDEYDGAECVVVFSPDDYFTA